MKLYEVPNNSKIRILEDNGEVLFHHPDGMYSYCTDKNNNVVHVYISTEVEVINDQNTPTT
jgi:hypothetical protein